MAVKPIPDGCQTVIPYLIVPDPAATIEFLKRTFDAVEQERMADDSGAIRHASVKIGDSVIMMGGAQANYPAMPCMTYVYVPDTDAAYARAVEAGATSVMPPADQFYGDRNAGVKDAAGFLWWMATHVEDVSTEELGRRHAELAKPQAKG
jgi:PhnB protein